MSKDIKEIDVKKFLKKDFHTILQFAYCLDEEAFKRKFKEYGIEVLDEEDLMRLAKLSESGKDKSGELKDKDGKPVKFDIKKIFSEINIRKDKIKSCSMKFKGIEELKTVDFSGYE